MNMCATTWSEAVDVERLKIATEVGSAVLDGDADSRQGIDDPVWMLVTERNVELLGVPDSEDLRRVSAQVDDERGQATAGVGGVSSHGSSHFLIPRASYQEGRDGRRGIGGDQEETSSALLLVTADKITVGRTDKSSIYSHLRQVTREITAF